MELSERERAIQGRADARVRRMQRKYERLASRRAVRVGLGVSRITAPWLRKARSLRSRLGRAGGGTPEGARQGVRGEGEDLGPRSLDVRGLLCAIEARGPVTVIVPVHNAREATVRCLRSVLRNSTNSTRVLVVDDASSDLSLVSFLDALQGEDGVEVIRLEENAGFAGAVNAGLGKADEGDVILLNSDVVVSPGWDRNLAIAARSQERVASVTPLSNRAGPLSAPGDDEAESVLEDLGLDGAARLIARSAERGYTEVPVGHGFCLYLTREAIDAVGLFDEEAFPRGYGEEVDWCFRAGRVGLHHLVDHRTYVWHEHGASFGERRDDLIRSGRAVIDQRYPDYSEVVRELRHSNALAEVREMVAGAWREAKGRPVPRVLYVTDQDAQCTHETAVDTASRMEGRYEPIVLEFETKGLHLYDLSGARRAHLATYELGAGWSTAGEAREGLREAFARVLWDYAIELVDIRRLVGDSLELPVIAKKLDVPVVCNVSALWPTWPSGDPPNGNRVDWNGARTWTARDCPTDSERHEGARAPKPTGMRTWQEAVGDALRGVERVVVCSDYTRSAFEARFGGRLPKAEVIEEGYELEQHRGVAVPPTERPARILITEDLELGGGTDLIRGVVELDGGERIEFHFLGDVPDACGKLGVVHGDRSGERLAERAAELAPSFAGVFSSRPDRCGPSLPEAWSLGLPVIAGDIGVVGERVKAHGGGWLVDCSDPRRAYEQIRAVIEDVPAWYEVAAQADLRGTPTVDDMRREYERLYGELLESDRGPGRAGDERAARGT